MSNPTLIKNYVAETAIPKRRLVKFGSTPGTVALATSATDAIIGVSAQDFDVAIGERCDVTRRGIDYVEAGAAFGAGLPITADANGRAVLAAPAAGANVRLLGFSEEAATALGDQVKGLIAQTFMQG